VERARANLGRLLRRVEDEQRSVAMGKRGAPKSVLISISANMFFPPRFLKGHSGKWGSVRALSGSGIL
jgi:prevent-host-death family protein